MNELLAECVGTMILIILGQGVVAGVVLKDSKAENSGWIVITIGWGLAVTMGVYAAGSISGAHLNPAVTLGLAFGGDFEWALVPGYIAAQFIGAILGSVIGWIHYLPHWARTKDPASKLAVFCTAPAVPNRSANIVSEVIGTFVLVFAIMFIGANEFTEGLNPLIVGFLVISIGLSLGGTTGYAINPARDLGPRLAHTFLPVAGKGSSNWGYSWIPVVGPIIGGVYGALLYNALFKGVCNITFWILTAIVLFIFILAVIEQRKKDSIELGEKNNKKTNLLNRN